MSNAGIPLRTIQEISGHRNLEQLQQYLEIQPEQVKGAIATLSMLSPVSISPDKIDVFPDIPTPQTFSPATNSQGDEF
jgi:integrase/recombinase XerD